MRVHFSKGPIIAAYIVAIGFSAYLISFVGGWPLLVNIASRIISNLLH